MRLGFRAKWNKGGNEIVLLPVISVYKERHYFTGKLQQVSLYFYFIRFLFSIDFEI
jgi:hypothetical protein